MQTKSEQLCANLRRGVRPSYNILGEEPDIRAANSHMLKAAKLIEELETKISNARWTLPSY